MRRIRHTGWLVLLLVVVPCGCAGGGGGTGTRGGVLAEGGNSVQTAAQRKQMRLDPSTKQVPDADLELLWKATRGYMVKVFPLDVDEQDKRYAETQTIEWTQNGVPSRTRIIAYVDVDEKAEKGGLLTVGALKIEPRFDLAQARSGRPLAYDWVLSKETNKQIEEIVINQIMDRYLLLRQGRNPDLVAPKKPIQGLPTPQPSPFPQPNR